VPHPDIPDDVDQFDEAVRAFRRRVPMAKKDWDALTARQREYAFSLAEATRADLAAVVYEAAEKAIRKGTTLEEFKLDITEKLSNEWTAPTAARAETVFRNVVLGSYNAGKHTIYSDPVVREARPYIRFDAAGDSRMSEICERLDKTVLPADDPFWSKTWPPLHHNCRSQPMALSAEEADDEGISRRAPDVDADDGFGLEPSPEGGDWEPKLREYPPGIREELRARLRGG
jgi:SPP1 gp7 family putative phage head morphogenesis protein